MQGPALGEQLAAEILGQPLAGLPEEEVRLARFAKALAEDPISLATKDHG
jgi:hypothetical protein